MDIPNWKCSKKLQRKKTITTIQIHYSAKLQKWKYEDEWKQSKSQYDSCAQDYSSLENQRLSLEKIHGQPFQKACSKSSGSSSAQGGKRIKLRRWIIFKIFRNFGKFLIRFRKIDWKATDLTLFWSLARNPETNSSKFRRKNAKFNIEIEKIGNSIIPSRKNVGDFWRKKWD